MVPGWRCRRRPIAACWQLHSVLHNSRYGVHLARPTGSSGGGKGEERKMDRSKAAGPNSGRGYLRVANRSGRNVHRQIHFDMPADEAIAWRDSLIAALKEATDNPTRSEENTSE